MAARCGRHWRLALTAAAVAAAAAAGATAASAAVLRWNAGGGSTGGGFAGDTPPGVSVVGGWSFNSGRAIAGTDLDGLYQSHRAGTFRYTVAAKPGTYEVRLHLAETWAPNYRRGARRMNFAAGDGATVSARANGVDVFARAGAGGKATDVVLYRVVVRGSRKLVVQCQSVEENCMISGVTVSTRSAGAGFLGGVGGGGGGGPPKGSNGGFDHRAHAVPGPKGYNALDFNGDGKERVTLDGRGSHSHYFNAGTGAAGRIVKYLWTHGSSGAWMGNQPTMTATFPRGRTPVKLTVTDNTGDVASDVTTVTVSAGASAGWWCYWLEGVTRLPPLWLKAAPRPVYAAPSGAVRFGDGKFGWAGYPSPFGTGWGLRCVTSVSVGRAGAYPFKVTANGPVGLYVGTKAVLSKPWASGARAVTTQWAQLAAGANDVTVVFWKRHPNLGTVQLDAPPGSSVAYAAPRLLPVLAGLSTATGGAAGGATVKLSGSGFFNGEVVYFGDKASATINDGGGSSSDTMYVRSPPGVAGTTVPVTVRTGNGVSNARPFRYVAGGGGGGGGGGGSTHVRYTSSFLKNKGGSKFTAVPLATSIALGADGVTYFVGSLKGNVYQVRVADHASMTVASWCKGPWSGPNRVITGVAVNPALTHGSFVYASSSIIKYRSKGLSVAQGWANGRVELYKSLSSGGCLVKVKDVITGLPVSANDHTIAGIAFDQRGDLLLQAGGSTNAGYNGPGSELSGMVDESPLSGATLIAYTSKGAAFNGRITYNQMGNPATAVQTGGDVAVYAAGLRNSFGILRHSSGTLFALDNGGNNGYGHIRTGCGAGAHKPFAQGGDPADTLVALRRGAYYGHPNANRGRKAPAQCVWRRPFETAGGATAALATLPSSTNGLTEMRSSVFRGALKGHLFFTKYVGGTAGAAGIMSTATVKGGGGGLQGGVSFFFSSGGLSVVANPMGALLMTRNQQGFIAAAVPAYRPGAAPEVLGVAPDRGPKRGGYRLYVAGYNFGGRPQVRVGGKPCTAVTVVGPHGLTCTAPAGSGKVPVTVNGSRSYGHDFEYMFI